MQSSSSNRLQSTASHCNSRHCAVTPDLHVGNCRCFYMPYEHAGLTVVVPVCFLNMRATVATPACLASHTQQPLAPATIRPSPSSVTPTKSLGPCLVQSRPHPVQWCQLVSARLSAAYGRIHPSWPQPSPLLCPMGPFLRAELHSSHTHKGATIHTHRRRTLP